MGHFLSLSSVGIEFMWEIVPNRVTSPTFSTSALRISTDTTSAEGGSAPMVPRAVG